MVAHPNRRRATKDKPSAQVAHNHEHDYSALLAGVRASFASSIAADVKLFATDADELYEIYLDALPSERQVHNCHSCRRFMAHFGGLVTISDDGETVPVMWNPTGVPEFYAFAFTSLSARIKRARIIAPFLSKHSVWGTPATGTWQHIAVDAPARFVYRENLLTADQAMAAAKENYRTVITALGEFTPAMLDEAARILAAGALARSEKFIGPVKWLRVLHDRPKGRKGENVLWNAIAKAPEGYCHPRSSVIGPLLEDIASGMEFDAIKARFDAKMGPLLYQRPQAAPSAGNIKAAEAIVEKMGLAPALERRFARIEDLQTAWLPAAAVPKGNAGSVFGHLTPKNSVDVVPVDLPTVTMTWDKFARTVLPEAVKLQIHVPINGRFIALTTATNADAPTILKWDNPVAWYVYPNGSPARQWGLTGGTWANVSAIAPFPTLWGSKPMPFLADGVILAIEGCVDTRTETGNALFPECLRDDLHGIRATVEAYSRSATLGGREAASACGYDVRKSSADCRLRAFVSGAWTDYRIDRWD